MPEFHIEQQTPHIRCLEVISNGFEAKRLIAEW